MCHCRGSAICGEDTVRYFCSMPQDVLNFIPDEAKGLLFDIDGTVLDSNGHRVNSWQKACSERACQ